VSAESSRERATRRTRDRIVEVALDVLGDDPDAGMGEIATAAGVVRRTVYGHFPTRLDLIRTLTERAVADMTAALADVDAETAASAAGPDAAWAGFIARLWPVAHRYRVLLALRRSEYGTAIHGLLGPLDELLADLVRRGQDTGAFADHLPPVLLSQIAYGAVFSVADSALADAAVTDAHAGARAATMTSLLVLGVPEAHALALIEERLDGSP
jgi:AcrR family transcriptional regulator